MYVMASWAFIDKQGIYCIINARTKDQNNVTAYSLPWRWVRIRNWFQVFVVCCRIFNSSLPSFSMATHYNFSQQTSLKFKITTIQQTHNVNRAILPTDMDDMAPWSVGNKVVSHTDLVNVLLLTNTMLLPICMAHHYPDRTGTRTIVYRNDAPPW